MTDLQQMLIMLAGTDESYEKKVINMNGGSKWTKIIITGRGIEIHFKEDGSLHYFSKSLNA